MLLFNYLPLTHVALIGLSSWLVGRWSIAAGVGTGLLVLYVLPPLVVRMALWLWPISEGKYALETSAFRVWWLTAQCHRMPMLEEALRVVPGLYSLWLRLWGAKVGGLVFWSPGTVVLDRPFVRIGDRCVLGSGVRLHPHLITGGDDGQGVAELWLSPVRIGEQSLVGGFSLLAPGVTVAPGSMTPAIHALPAFSEWRADRRTRRVRPTTV